MDLVRIAASAAAVTLLSTACATAKPIATTAETNLRKSAGTDSPVLTIIPKGATVEIGKCSKGWCEASFESRDGFVIARNIGLASPRRTGGAQVYDEAVVDRVGAPTFAPPIYYGFHGPYYGYAPYYGYGPYYGYYGGWAYRGWNW
jgi:uncharacterized protein YraI